MHFTLVKIFTGIVTTKNASFQIQSQRAKKRQRQRNKNKALTGNGKAIPNCVKNNEFYLLITKPLLQ